jgi:hypothetical protein
MAFFSPNRDRGTACFAPIFSPGGVAFFGRDMETAHQVWSAEQGYPGDFNYREFYRDIGYDLDYNYVRPYLHDDGVRRNTGIKYHRVTGRVALADKEPYVPSRARSTAASHAGNFLFNRERQVDYLRGVMNRPPLVTSVYDAELFGHWWFEGPDFLDVPSPQNPFRPKCGEDDPSGGIPPNFPGTPNRRARTVQLGRQRLPRSLVERVQRLGLSPPPHRGGTHDLLWPTSI